jgi:putative membrane protein
MRFLFKIILAFIINLIALLAAHYFVTGFILATGDWKTLAILTIALTALNYLLKPLLKLLLGPLIVLTLGLGMVFVNALILVLLDFFSPALSIQGIVPLVEATLIISIINFVFHLAL